MDRIRGGVGHSERAGRLAAAAGAQFCVGNDALFLCFAASIAENRGDQSSNCIPGLERRPAQDSHWRAATESGLDGGGVCPAAEVLEREYRRSWRSRWAWKLPGRAPARERRAVA